MSDTEDDRTRDGNEYRKRAEEKLNERLEQFEKRLNTPDGESAAVADSLAAERNASGFNRFIGLSVNKTEPKNKRFNTIKHYGNLFKRLTPHIHDGHRQRLRDSIKDDKKLSGFGDIRLLEVLLSFFIPQKDTNVTAHALINRFGSILGVLRASEDELAGFPAITVSAATALPMLASLCLCNGGEGIKITSPSAAADYFGAVYRSCDCDCMFVAYLDKRFELITVERMSCGDKLPVRAIADSAHNTGTSYVLIVRRDKSIFPAEFDLAERVFELSSTLDMGGVKLLDFMMFTDYGYYTLGDPPKGGDWYVKYMFVPLLQKTLPTMPTDISSSSRNSKNNPHILQDLSEFLGNAAGSNNKQTIDKK